MSVCGSQDIKPASTVYKIVANEPICGLMFDIASTEVSIDNPGNFLVSINSLTIPQRVGIIAVDPINFISGKLSGTISNLTLVSCYDHANVNGLLILQ